MIYRCTNRFGLGVVVHVFVGINKALFCDLLALGYWSTLRIQQDSAYLWAKNTIKSMNYNSYLKSGLVRKSHKLVINLFKFTPLHTAICGASIADCAGSPIARRGSIA